jgi:Fe2+ transport system protein FeoA
MQCPLCGLEFDETEMSCHSSCAFNQACGIICCPNCGYQVNDISKSRIAGFLQKVLARRNARAKIAGVYPLSALSAGQSAKVVRLTSEDHARQERLNVFGLMPGATVTLQQRQPAFVLRVGFTELSIERNIAEEIMVEIA